MIVTPAQKEIFLRQGILPLRQLIPKKNTLPIKSLILSELEKMGLLKMKSSARKRLQDLPVFQQTAQLSQKLKLEANLIPLFTEHVLGVVASILNLAVKRPPHPHLLLSLPHKVSWSLKNLNWHVDLAIPNKDEISGVQVFVLIDDVEPRGGATLALAGSHKLPYLKTNLSKNALQFLRQDRFFSCLFSSTELEPEKFFKPTKVEETEVFIFEMSGKAGDVFLMDMRVLHSPAVNSLHAPRMMATCRFAADGKIF